jgi:hypothetical protein
MPVDVTIVDSDREPAIVKVTHLCEGCGEKIRTFKAFADTVDTDVKPIHNSVECLPPESRGRPS